MYYNYKNMSVNYDENRTKGKNRLQNKNNQN